jgi:hypothetical protein
LKSVCMCILLNPLISVIKDLVNAYLSSVYPNHLDSSCFLLLASILCCPLRKFHLTGCGSRSKFDVCCWIIWIFMCILFFLIAFLIEWIAYFTILACVSGIQEQFSNIMCRIHGIK